MQQFIDNLISRLEEEKEAYSDTTYYALGVGSAIEIVNQLAEEYKPRTNADRIRSMDDAELAKEFSEECARLECLHCNHDVTCDKCWLEWLQSEVKEGE